VDRKALFIALGLAVLGGVCLLMYMQRFEAETSGGPKVPVLIATRDIPIGASLQRAMLGIRNLPQAYVEQRHILYGDIDTVVGARMSMAVHANEAVLWSDLASMQAERRDLSGLIEPGMRAMVFSARGSGGASSFGGLLRPGDRVDILHTPGHGSSGGPVTITLLQNVVVLAVGGDTGGGNEGGGAYNGRVITVSVTPEQAQLILHASTEGPLDVVLRNPEDIVVLKDLPEVGEADIREPARRDRFIRRPTATPVAIPQPQPKVAPHVIDRVR
jgi:pilus assembly protein CpaB